MIIMATAIPMAIPIHAPIGSPPSISAFSSAVAPATALPSGHSGFPRLYTGQESSYSFAGLGQHQVVPPDSHGSQAHACSFCTPLGHALEIHFAHQVPTAPGAVGKVGVVGVVGVVGAFGVVIGVAGAVGVVGVVGAFGVVIGVAGTVGVVGVVGAFGVVIGVAGAVGVVGEIGCRTVGYAGQRVVVFLFVDKGLFAFILPGCCYMHTQIWTYQMVDPETI
jgi:hypothetical protein